MKSLGIDPGDVQDLRYRGNGWPGDEASALAAEVDKQGGVTDRRHVTGKTGGLGDDVLVGHGHDRDVNSGQAPDLVGVDASGVDDDVTLDAAVVGLDGAHRSTIDVDARDARLGEDRRPALACPLGERQGELARVQVPVGRQERSPVETVDRHRGEQPQGLLGRHHVQGQPERLGPSSLSLQLLHPFGRRGEPQRADLAPARLELDFLFEVAVELDRVHHHLGEAERRAQLADKPG